MYAFPHFLRWVCCGLVCVFSGRALGQQTLQLDAVNHKARLIIKSVTLVAAPSTYDVTWTCTSNIPVSGTTADTASIRWYVNTGIVYSRGGGTYGFASKSGVTRVIGTPGSDPSKYYTQVRLQRDSGPAMPAGVSGDISCDLRLGPVMEVGFVLQGGENGTAYSVYQGGTKVEDIQIAAGDEYIYKYKTWSENPVYLNQLNIDRTSIDGFWYDTPTSVSSTATATGTPSATFPPVTVPAPNSGAGSVSVIGSGPAAEGDTWAPRAVTGLTADLYREGVEKIVEEVRKGNGGGGSSGGGDGVDHEGIASGNPTEAEREAAGTNASNSGKTAWGTVSLSVPSISGSPPLFAIADPFSGKTFDMNPFREDRFGPTAAWLRAFGIWLLVAGFAVYAVSIASETVKDVSQARQAKGNPVLAGTGAQATALVAAAAITVAVLVVIVAMAGWKDVTLAGSGGTIIAILGINPMASAPAGVVWMIDQIWPIGTTLAVLLAKISFRMVATASFIGASAIIRFVVP